MPRRAIGMSSSFSVPCCLTMAQLLPAAPQSPIDVAKSGRRRSCASKRQQLRHADPTTLLFFLLRGFPASARCADCLLQARKRNATERISSGHCRQGYVSREKSRLGMDHTSPRPKLVCKGRRTLRNPPGSVATPFLGPPQSSANCVYSKHDMKQAVREKVALPHGHPVCNMKAVTDGAGWSGNATLVRTTTPNAARPLAPPQPPTIKARITGCGRPTHLPVF